eukprot:TRINITY_DN57080_c0_g1_i1.p1 TRINITY_DN57080_c0_g1~~TRINITY_DN57080_c0_g1_i1.p1  ORF type:complete len:277 (-),score=42.90 TRINITY_DN57080_c0_g1_i1:35-790(-)
MAPVDRTDASGEGGCRALGNEHHGGAEDGLLRELLGADERSADKELRRLAADLCTEAVVESKAFPDCRYISCKQLGLSIRLRPADGGMVDVVFLYNEGVDGFSAYEAGPLPSGLRWSDVSRDVVARLGEPSDRFGGGRVQIGISYETEGLDVHFQNRDWDDARNPLTFLSVFGRTEQAFDLCANCAKRASFNCGSCKQRRYCSSACQKADWPRHQGHCARAASCQTQLQQSGEFFPRIGDLCAGTELESMD